MTELSTQKFKTYKLQNKTYTNLLSQEKIFAIYIKLCLHHVYDS